MNEAQRAKYLNSTYAGITTKTLIWFLQLLAPLAWSLRINEWIYFPIT